MSEDWPRTSPPQKPGPQSSHRKCPLSAHFTHVAVVSKAETESTVTGAVTERSRLLALWPAALTSAHRSPPLSSLGALLSLNPHQGFLTSLLRQTHLSVLLAHALCEHTCWIGVTVGKMNREELNNSLPTGVQHLLYIEDWRPDKALVWREVLGQSVPQSPEKGKCWGGKSENLKLSR